MLKTDLESDQFDYGKMNFSHRTRNIPA